jgi:hypothetical protein
VSSSRSEFSQSFLRGLHVPDQQSQMIIYFRNKGLVDNLSCPSPRSDASHRQSPPLQFRSSSPRTNHSHASKVRSVPEYPFKVEDIVHILIYCHMLFPLLTDALSCQDQHIIRHNDNKVKHGANEVIAVGAIIDYMN